MIILLFTMSYFNIFLQLIVLGNKLQENFLVLLSDLFKNLHLDLMNTPSLPCRSWLYQLFSDFSVTPFFFFFFFCKLTPNTGNCYFCIFLIFLTEFSSVLFFETPIHFFFFGKQSGKSVRVTLYTLLQLSLGTRVPNTKRTLFTSCSHTRHVPVCNSKAICWGSLSPVPSPFQNCLLF